MAVSIGIQQPPLPIYAISAPLALNYLDTPHATTQADLWKSGSVTLSAPVLREDEDERYLRFTRTATGAALISVNDSQLDIPAGTFDVRLSIRTTASETGCTLGLRVGQSQAAGDNKTGSSFTAAAGAWVEKLASVTIAAGGNWTLVLHLGNGSVGTLIDVKLGSIMPSGQAPFFGDMEPSGTDFYYWESATNDSKSIHAHRTISNVPGPYYTVENLTTYTITENATPLSAADTSGGATTVQLGIEEFEDSVLLGTGELTVFDDGVAVVQGEISGPSSDGVTVSITSMSIISKLNVVRTVAPFVGSLDEYLAYLLASVGVTRPLTVDLGIAERQIAAPGFKDNILSKVKEFCSVQGVELSDKGDAVFIRLPRERVFNGENLTQTGRSSDISQLAQSVEVMNYNSQYLEGALIYPPASYDDNTGMTLAAGWTPDAPILTVDSGSVTTIEVPIIGSLMDVEQPVCVKEVGPDDGPGGSVYTVIGQGNSSGDSTGSIETLDPATWAALGGSVSVKVGPTFDTIIITITSGSNEPTLAPFALAMNAGDSTYYSSLRLRGTGIITHPEKFTYPTGLGPNDTTNEVGASIDSPYVQTREMAEHVARETVPLYSRPTVQITAGAGDVGLAIGDIAGARFRQGDSFYRVTSAPSSEGGVSITAVADTTMDDFDEVWSTKTFDDFDAVWETRTEMQFSAAPLRDT